MARGDWRIWHLVSLTNLYQMTCVYILVVSSTKRLSTNGISSGSLIKRAFETLHFIRKLHCRAYRFGDSFNCGVLEIKLGTLLNLGGEIDQL